MATFVRGTGAPAEMVAAMRNEPFWPRMVQLAPTLPNDLILADGGRVPAERLSHITVDTVTVSGGNSHAWAARSCAAIAAAVPHARHEVLAGQTHAAADDVLAPWLRAHFLTWKHRRTPRRPTRRREAGPRHLMRSSAPSARSSVDRAGAF